MKSERCPSCFMRDLDIDMFYDPDKKDVGKWAGFLYPAQLMIFGLLSMMIK